MITIEDAYIDIATKMTESCNASWDKLVLVAGVRASMVRSVFSIFYKDALDESKSVRGISTAALYLRDNLLATTGQRIWGLTFTLYPDGKFNIEYDYNKPEDYEETDEVITGDEINARLSEITSKKSS